MTQHPLAPPVKEAVEQLINAVRGTMKLQVPDILRWNLQVEELFGEVSIRVLLHGASLPDRGPEGRA